MKATKKTNKHAHETSGPVLEFLDEVLLPEGTDILDLSIDGLDFRSLDTPRARKRGPELERPARGMLPGKS